MKGRRILLVEDAEFVRQSIKDSLERAGYVVDEAQNGRAALDLYGKIAFDAIITDLWMPEMDGVDLLDHLRCRQANLPVIAISGGAPGKAPLDYSITLAQTFGADAVFHKPFDNDDLVAKVGELMADPHPTKENRN